MNFKKNFGFGLMRLPMSGEIVDYEQTVKMVDCFMEAGFNYFDTAKGYIDGQSETAFRDCVAKRYPRDSFVITNKLSPNFFETQEEIRPLVEEQLKACGVDYFDFYLMHSQNKGLFEKYKKCNAYETIFELKKEGKIRHVGISFHDTANVLDEILTEYPEIEIVQIQFNYVDYLDKRVQGKECYEVCEAHGKPIIVMEPVKGGSLVNLPDEATELLSKLGGGSNASYAIRYAASFPQTAMVISGMSNMEQALDNINTMKNFEPLSEAEYKAIDRVVEIFRKQDRIPCTSCRYCVSECPSHIPIPGLISVLNTKKVYNNDNCKSTYEFFTNGKGKASDCIKCGKCEKICPQKLEIRNLMDEMKKEFE